MSLLLDFIPGDETARLVATMPGWASVRRNSVTVKVDAAGIAHAPKSRCWRRKGIKATGSTTVGIALANGRLCRNCQVPHVAK